MVQDRCCCSLRPVLGPAAAAWEACGWDLRPGLREAGAAGAERGCALSPVSWPGSALLEAWCWGLKPALCVTAAGGPESEDGSGAGSARRWDLRGLTAAARGSCSCQRWTIWCSRDPMAAGCEGPAGAADSSSEDDDKAVSGTSSRCSSCATPSACKHTK